MIPAGAFAMKQFFLTAACLTAALLAVPLPAAA